MIPHNTRIFCNKNPTKNAILALGSIRIDSRSVHRYPRVITVWDVALHPEDGGDIFLRNISSIQQTT